MVLCPSKCPIGPRTSSMEPRRNQHDLDIPHSKCTICGSSLPTEQPESSTIYYRAKCTSGIPRSLRSCSFNYLAVSALFRTPHTRESPHLQNLAEVAISSLTRRHVSSRCETGIDRPAKCSSNEHTVPRHTHTRARARAELYINTSQGNFIASLAFHYPLERISCSLAFDLH